MIETYTYGEEGYRVLLSSHGWKIGMLRWSERFSAFTELENHTKSDEIFVLLGGSATLYTETESKEMESGVVYCIPAGEWHHIVVSRDASVLIVEDEDTSRENTLKKIRNPEEKQNHVNQ